MWQSTGLWKAVAVAESPYGPPAVGGLSVGQEEPGWPPSSKAADLEPGSCREWGAALQPGTPQPLQQQPKQDTGAFKLHKNTKAIITPIPFQYILMAFHILLVGPVSSELFRPFLLGAACASSDWPGSASRSARSRPVKTSVKLLDSMAGAYQV